MGDLLTVLPNFNLKTRRVDPIERSDKSFQVY